jgi:ACDE family multidrug resistance protein
MKKQVMLPFIFLCSVPFIMVLGNSMLIPLLPAIQSALKISLFKAGLLITAFSIPAGIIIPFAGYLSDRYGRKIIIAPSLIIYGAGGIIAGTASLLLAKPYFIILAGRIIQGIGAGGTYQLAMALTGDIFQSQERTKALGILESSNGLGKVVSPIAGSALGLIIWYAPFFVYGFLAIPIAAAIWFIVKEPNKSQKKQNNLQKYITDLKKIFKEKGFPLLASFLAGGIVLFILFGTLSYISDILKSSYNIKGFSTGLLIAIPVASMAITSYLSGLYLAKQNSHLLKLAIVTGLSMLTGAMAFISFISNIYILFIALIIMGAGTGLVLPAVNTLITSAASIQERGIITCLYGSSRFFGVAIGPPAFGLVTEIGKTPLFLGASAIVAAAAVISFILIKENILLPPGVLQGN